jgi:mono/diheme cytochrome c family protein
MGLAPRAGALRRGFALPLLVAVLIGLAFVWMPDVAASGQAAGAAGRGDPERGEKLFGRTGCNGCHQINGIGGQVGPDLSRVFHIDLAKDRPGQKQPNVRDYVRESIKDPQAYIVPSFPKPSPMPSAEKFELAEQDIDHLIAYLEQAGRADAK